MEVAQELKCNVIAKIMNKENKRHFIKRGDMRGDYKKP